MTGHKVFVHGNDIIDRLAIEYNTVEFPKPDFGPPKLDRLAVIKAAMDLVIELWPQPGYASVTLETHQWDRLRQLLLAIPELVAHDE